MTAGRTRLAYPVLRLQKLCKARVVLCPGRVHNCDHRSEKRLLQIEESRGNASSCAQESEKNLVWRRRILRSSGK